MISNSVIFVPKLCEFISGLVDSELFIVTIIETRSGLTLAISINAIIKATLAATAETVRIIKQGVKPACDVQRHSFFERPMLSYLTKTASS